MSAVIRRVNGVLLRYPDPSVLRPHHAALKFQPSDRLRCSVVKAQREVSRLWILVEHLDVSDIGLERMANALKAIDTALNQARDELGLARE